jgi:hypothetical protein
MLRFFALSILLLCNPCSYAQQKPTPWPSDMKPFGKDWLVQPVNIKADVYISQDGKDIILYNGLVKRVFRIKPNVACIEYTNLANGQQLLRAVKPEAVIRINGEDHNVGGLYGQKEKAYLLNEWVDKMTARETDMQFVGYEITALTDHLKWKPAGWTANTKSSTGKLLSFRYADPRIKGLEVNVHYEIHDGMPLIVKYVTMENRGSALVKIDRVKNEILDLVEEESAVVGSPAQMKTQQGIYVETNYAFNNAMRYQISDQTTHWKIDSSYTSQVNYNYETPCVLEVYPDKAPGIELKPGEKFQSVRTYELLMDSYDRERRGLFVRKMYNKIAPWTSSNPIFMHLVSRNDEEVIKAINQCDSTGYEAVILSFGSHLNMEDLSDANLQRWKKLADYAHSKGLMIGGYSLFSSRRISEEDDVINPATGKTGGAFFGNAPCFGSKWGLAYRDKIKSFFTYTGFNIWENDGPYPGDLCASTSHPGHNGVDDSQWRQMEMQKDLYRWLNEKGVYINAPDWYFLDGTHKIAIGYREVNFSLPRENQMILNRQNIFDGTWEKTPSMGWGFVPLVKYQGGGPEAVLEPLSEHLKDYEQLMMQYYGAGVQACYRGPRLYDTEQTRQTVIKVINWYKKYRDILNADLIHLRRADGRDWDGWLHVAPGLKQKGLMMLFNPTGAEIRKVIDVPLYYTGMTSTVKIREKEGVVQTLALDRNYTVKLPVVLKPYSYSWWIVE